MAHDLSGIAAGQRLSSVYFYKRDRFFSTILPPDVRSALRRLVGQRARISSNGKLLVLSSGSIYVSIHLGMTGQFRTEPVPQNHRRHHFMTLRWGRTRCRFLDFRRFSRARVGSPEREAALGGFDLQTGLYLRPPESCSSKIMTGATTSPRMAWLLRHGKLTGIGNYLANEALGRLDLSPFSPCRSAAEGLTILRMCQRIARESYCAGGTSFGIGYWRLDGTEGGYAKQLQFYQNPKIERSLYRNRSVYSRFSPRSKSPR